MKTTFRFAAAAAAASLIGSLTSTHAATADGDLVTQLVNCRRQSDSAVRLACFDALAGPLSELSTTKSAADSGSMKPQATASKDASAASQFGLPSPAAPVSAVTARITSIRGDQSHPVISLDNGQTWTLLDAGESRLSEGISVTIRPAALGSYLMTGVGLAQSHRVRRLK